MASTAWNIAIVGAGPVGLALALQAARTLPQAQVTVFDARPLQADVAADPRTLALSLGSVQMLQRLGAWPAEAAEPILQVHVSQQPPTLATPWGPPEVLLTHTAMQVPLLGAVLRYGSLVAALQTAWLQAEAAQPQRLRSRFGTTVAGLKDLPSGVEVDAGIAEPFDLAVVAEGGVFGEQARKALTRDYAQTAWVGTATLQGAQRGRAFERFTREGPAALLPLPPAADGALRAALVWCVNAADDPVRDLSDAQRLAVLNTMFPPSAGRVTALSPLKGLPLGLNAERTLVQRRTIRIGNAAQTLHPVAGQGLNLGLRDAHSLLAALRGASDIDQALKRTEWQRAPDRWATIATTDFLARSFTWQLPGAPSLRGLGLAALQAAPPLQRWLAHRMMFGVR
jgi:2-octaprenyl-6-methoxyphenol hydroxylase